MNAITWKPRIKTVLGLAGALCCGTALFAWADPPFFSLAGPTAQEARESQQHYAWISSALEKIQTLHPGMTRTDLLKLFTTEGGLYIGSQRTYIYRACPLIKVDVEFRIVGRPERDKEGRVTLTEKAGDVITKISKPYLDWTPMD